MEKDIYTQEFISDIIKQTGEEKDTAKIVEKVSSERPKATREDFADREDDVIYHKYLKEEIHGKRIPESLIITPSEKALAQELEITPIVLTRLMVTQEWKDLIMVKQFGEEYKSLRDPNTQITQDTNYIVERDILINKLKEDIGEDEFFNLASKTVFDYIKNLENKANVHNKGNLTAGLELEISTAAAANIETFNQIKKIDTLQEFGYPVTYDALREIPLPKSASTYEQLKAVLELMKAGFIKPEYHIGIHFNVEGIKVDEDLYLLDKLIYASNIFNYEIGFGETKIQPEHAIKPLYEGEYTGPDGLPFVIRTSGVVEFRWLPPIENMEAQSLQKQLETQGIKEGVKYEDYVRGLETMTMLLEALAAYQRVASLGYENNSPRDLELSKVWSNLKNQTLGAFSSYGLNEDECEYFYEDCKDYTDHLRALSKNVATHVDAADANKYPEQTNRFLAKTKKNRDVLVGYIKEARAKTRELLNSEEKETS